MGTFYLEECGLSLKYAENTGLLSRQYLFEGFYLWGKPEQVYVMVLVAEKEVDSAEYFNKGGGVTHEEIIPYHNDYLNVKIIDKFYYDEGPISSVNFDATS